MTIPAMIKGRCVDCKYYKSLGRLNGWCKDNREGRKSIRSTVFDFCDNFESK